MRYHIKGLDCPHCAMGLEKYIQGHDHVKYVKLDFTKGIIDIELDDEQYFDELYKDIKKLEPVTLTKKEIKFNINIILIIRLLISVLFLILGFVFNNLYLYITSYVIISYDVIIKAIKNIFKGNVFDERFLMSIASIGAFFIKEYHEACMVMILYSFGEFLQELAINKSRQKIYDLVDFKVDTCNVKENDNVVVKDVKDVKIDDIIEVRLGEKIPLDGILLSEHGTFNTQSLTGEAEYLEIDQNNEVISGYINEGSVIDIKVNKEYNDSTIKKIVDMIENATNNKTKTETFITKFAKIYTPIVCSLAVIIFIVLMLLKFDFARSLNSALIFLVVSCPCALILSIPLLYFASIGKCSKEGILVKGSSYLEEATKIDNIIFDKTGTLTTGEFIVSDYSDEDTLNIASNLEQYSIHPLAKSITKHLKTKLDVKDFKEEKGRGVSGIINDKHYYLGNYRYIKENNIEVTKKEGALYLIEDNKYKGYIYLKDSIKEEVKETLEKLNDYHLVLLSGDNEKNVREIADTLNIKDYYFNKLPHEKVEVSSQYKNSIYVGDGVNDSISLINAKVGVSMGIKGSDASIEVSDVVLVKDNIKDLYKFINIAKKTNHIAIFNVIFILSFKLLFLILAGFNLIGMSMAIFADVGVALLCVFNSLRILK